MTKKELSQLIQLAIIDGDLAEREGKIIFAVGKQQGFSEEEIKSLIKSPEPIGPIEAISNEEKFHFSNKSCQSQTFLLHRLMQ